MKWNSVILYIGLLICLPLKLGAYEIETHASVTKQTIPRTVLTDNNFLQALGLDKYNNDFGLIYFDYYDSITGEIQKRITKSFEKDIIKGKLDEATNSLKGWFMRGAIREDDCWAPFVCTFVWDDPVNANRPLNHFFDPYSNTALSSLVETAPNWALGTKDAFKSPLTPIGDDDFNYTKYNHFTIFDAQIAMSRALSSQYLNNTGTVVKLDASQRKAYWATTFRTLGNIVHLIQDMGQPQHTRNDSHSKINTLEQQVYEKFINARALDDDYECIYGEIIEKDKLSPLSFKLNNGIDYPNPNFKKYSDFFSTLPGGAGQDGQGLADYSNREFFTAGTNKGDKEYPSPNNKTLTDTKVKFTSSCVTEFAADFTIYEGTVEDQNDISKNAVVSLTSRSVWDLNDLNIWGIDDPRNTLPKFSLTQQNYNQMADSLIPRAVAYSAGLINHFFRGRLDVTKSEQTADTSGNAIIAITIKNTSAQNFHMSNGKLEVFYDAIVDGEEVRKPVQLAQGETGNITELKNGVETTLKIILPTNIDPTKENPFVAVYKGIIGEEPGVAGKVFSIKDETAILLFYEQGGSNDLLVKRSVDEGKTWKFVDATNFAGFNLYANSRGNQLLPSGKGRGLLVGHNSTGIFTLRTTDNGKSWDTHLEQAYGQYTEVLNVIKAIHAGDGRLITYNNIYSGSYTVGTRTYYTYDVGLSESFDDGANWTPVGFSVDVQGRGVQLYYLGNQHLYLLTSGYDDACNCVTNTWYESIDSGENFSKALFTQNEIEWQPSWYRDAYSFDDERIVTINNTSTDRAVLEYNFAISNDGGKTITVTDSAAKNGAWPQTEPIHIRPTGQGEFISYVFDPWTAYEKNHESHYEGILVSKDKGQSWKEMYQGSLPTWDSPWYLMMGVLTNDGNNLKYIH